MTNSWSNGPTRYRKQNGEWIVDERALPPGRAAGPPRVAVKDVWLPSCLERGQRGAIIMQAIKRSPAPPGYFSVGGGQFDEDGVRSTLLLFDRLDSPQNSMFGLEHSVPPGLEDYGICQNTFVELDGNLSPDLYEKILEAAFDALNDRESGRWAIARTTQSLGLNPEKLEPQAGFVLKLLNALPIPDRSVPYEDVLSFKDRRRDELQCMRHHIEQLAIEVARNGYAGLAETVAVERFDKDLAAYAKASREANFLKKLTSLEVSFNWAAFAQGMAPAISLGSLEQVLAASIGAAGAALEVSSGFGLKGVTDLQPFEYLFRAEREL